MKLPKALHRWDLPPRRARAIQAQLASRVICKGTLTDPRLIAGADLAFTPGGYYCVAGVVVWDAHQGEVVERRTAFRKVRFPYVPGLLSFREGPALLAAIRKLRTEPDAFIFDGQGMAHPRRLGLASHMGIAIDRPSVGCAKSRLIGEHAEPSSAKGSRKPLIHDGERIGTVLRTRDAVRCVYVSIGHRVDLRSAERLVLRCAVRFRLPEPTRLADQLVGRVRNEI